MTTQFKIFPCRAKGAAPRPARTGNAATRMCLPPQRRHRTLCTAAPRRRKPQRTGRARRARARSLREREGKMQTPSIPLLKEERKNRTPPFPAYCVGLPPPSARPAHRALYAPAPRTHTRCTPVTPRTLHRRASVPRVSHTRATRPVSFAHRRAARKAKAAPYPSSPALIRAAHL